MRVKVLSRAEVESGEAEGCDAVISIRGSTSRNEPQLVAALAQATRGESARQLRLLFDDVGLPTYRHLLGPTMTQISDAVAFGRSVISGHNLFDGPIADPLIAVHCEQGRSRSAAVALTLLADYHGAGNERDAVNVLLRIDSLDWMYPNPLAISLADACLFRYGRLESVLAELSPRFFQWRAVWQEIALDPEGTWERAERMVRRKKRDAGAA